eukprot:scaffold7358_cov252-Pinguiococcus_pyrenoidosus.AAC.43
MLRQFMKDSLPICSMSPSRVDMCTGMSGQLLEREEPGLQRLLALRADHHGGAGEQRDGGGVDGQLGGVLAEAEREAQVVRARVDVHHREVGGGGLVASDGLADAAAQLQRLHQRPAAHLQLGVGRVAGQAVLDHDGHLGVHEVVDGLVSVRGHDEQRAALVVGHGEHGHAAQQVVDLLSRQARVGLVVRLLLLRFLGLSEQAVRGGLQLLLQLLVRAEELVHAELAAADARPRARRGRRRDAAAQQDRQEHERAKHGG